MSCQDAHFPQGSSRPLCDYLSHSIVRTIRLGFFAHGDQEVLAFLFYFLALGSRRDEYFYIHYMDTALSFFVSAMPMPTHAPPTRYPASTSVGKCRPRYSRLKPINRMMIIVIESIAFV